MRKCGYRQAKKIQAREAKKAEKERSKAAPRPLPQKRPRSLSICASNDSEIPDRKWYSFIKPTPQRTCNQSQSPLFVLPSEIRQLIWTYALGGRVLHVARGYRRLIAISCPDDDAETKHFKKTVPQSCWSFTPPLSYKNVVPRCYSYPHEDTILAPSNLLSLPKTCRRIYTETVNLLYQENVFGFDHPDMVKYLQQTILPQRLHQIRKLHLVWNFDLYTDSYPEIWDYEPWWETCKILAQFGGLQEVYIRLNGSMNLHLDAYFNEDRLRFWRHMWMWALDPLARVKVTKRFEVLVQWPERLLAATREAKEYPFDLILADV